MIQETSGNKVEILKDPFIKTSSFLSLIICIFPVMEFLNFVAI